MGWQIPICQKERSPLQSFKKSMPGGICRIGIRQPICKGRRPLKKVCLAAFAESEFGIGLANSDLPKRTQSFKKMYAWRHLPNRNSATHFLLPNRNSATQVFCYRLFSVKKKSLRGRLTRRSTIRYFSAELAKFSFRLTEECNCFFL